MNTAKNRNSRSDNVQLKSAVKVFLFIVIIRLLDSFKFEMTFDLFINQISVPGYYILVFDKKTSIQLIEDVIKLKKSLFRRSLSD